MANEEKQNLPEKSEKKTPEKKKKPSRIAKWFREMRSELKKVIWPTPKQTTKNTGVALFMMFTAAIVIWGFDSFAQAIVQALITITG